MWRRGWEGRVEAASHLAAERCGVSEGILGGVRLEPLEQLEAPAGRVIIMGWDRIGGWRLGAQVSNFFAARDT